MADSKITRIYVLRDPRDGAVRYVGKTSKSLAARYWQHTGRAANRAIDTYCARWIRGLIAAGLAPIMEQVDAAGADWSAREAFWITHYREAGARLTNLTRGGEGAPGLKMTAEQRAAIKAARACPQWRALVSSKMKALWADADTKAVRSRKTKAAKSRPEVRAAMSKATLAWWAGMTSEQREQQARRTKAGWNPERAKAQQDRNAERWADPEWRAATIARMRAVAGTAEARQSQAARSQKLALSAEWRANLSASKRQAYAARPDPWKKAGEALKGRVFSPETIERMRIAARVREARKRAARVQYEAQECAGICAD